MIDTTPIVSPYDRIVDLLRITIRLLSRVVSNQVFKSAFVP